MFENKYIIKMEPRNKEIEEYLKKAFLFKSLYEDHIRIAKGLKNKECEYFVFITNIFTNNKVGFKL